MTVTFSHSRNFPSIVAYVLQFIDLFFDIIVPALKVFPDLSSSLDFGDFLWNRKAVMDGKPLISSLWKHCELIAL